MRNICIRRYYGLCRIALTVILITMLCLVTTWPVFASDTPNPTSVTIAGSLQTELGAPGDWDPTAAATHLTYDGTDDVWQGVFTVPSGNWEYKAALNDSWVENYGRNATRDGANIALSLAASTSIKFYYDHETHWITDNVNSVIATVPGSYQSEIGCPGDWDPGCLRSWLQDPDGNGIYSFQVTITAGSYEAKVAIDESWNENYGQGGTQNGANIPFTVPVGGALVRFDYDSSTHLLNIIISGSPSPSPGPEVGGNIYPVSTVSLLAPLIASAIVLAAGITILIRRHRAQS